MPKAVEEEVVIWGQGEQQIVVKAGPKKPKLENLTLSQWSVANLAILNKLVADGKLKDESLMDYLSYFTKIYQLVQKCSLASVLLYDHEYRQLQANMSFSWGTDGSISTLFTSISVKSWLLRDPIVLIRGEVLLNPKVQRKGLDKALTFVRAIMLLRVAPSQGASSSIFALCQDVISHILSLHTPLKKTRH